ncbi:MAG: hypothetical protein RL839_01935, partial [Gammaproteobacteria bacterium]
STYQISDVTITHSGVSPLVGLLLRNNKSTRYAAFFQPASNTRFNYNSASFRADYNYSPSIQICYATRSEREVVG